MLTASFFGDVNEIELEKEATKIIAYPSQLKIVEKSNMKATVTNSYFKEGLYLIEVEYNAQKLFLNHTTSIEKEKTYTLRL